MFRQLIRPYTRVSHFLLGAIVISVVMTAAFWRESLSSPRYFIISTTWSLTIFLTQWMGHVFIGIKLDEKWPILQYPAKRITFGAIGFIIYAVSAFLIVQIAMYFIVTGGLPQDLWNWALSQTKISVSIAFVFTLFFTAIGYFKSWKKAELNAQKLETEMLRYKYESLQNQINPHFLFNSFNVLSDLVEDEPQLAKEFIQKMSGLYRYVLESRDRKLVSLAEELAFIRSYIFLIKTRFEDKLEVKITVDNPDGFYIVPMALQLLIENATKHNVATSNKILKVNIHQNGGSIRVTNNLQPKSSLESSTKKGLQNLRQQYSFFTEQALIIQETEEFFSVEIPLLDKEEV